MLQWYYINEVLVRNEAKFGYKLFEFNTTHSRRKMIEKYLTKNTWKNGNKW